MGFDPERLRLYQQQAKTKHLNLIQGRATQPADLPPLQAQDWTTRLKSPQGAQSLRPLQARALDEIASLPLQSGSNPVGVLGLIGVGGGKTLVTILAAHAAQAQRPVLVLPADMRDAFVVEYTKAGKHWRLPQNFRFLTYSEVSVASGEDKLKYLNPDLLIFDEAHNLANPDSARTRKFLRYIEENPKCKLVFLSGTLTRRSLTEYAHMFKAALRGANPLPASMHEAASWSKVLDARTTPEDSDYAHVRAFYEGFDKEEAQKAYGEWLAKQRFVINVPNSVVCEATIFIHQHKYEAPASVRSALTEFEATWTRPDGEEIASALDAFRLRTQLSQGFYYRWDWPNGKVDFEWLDARKRWAKALRSVLNRHIKGLDSPLLVSRALASGALADVEALEAMQGWHKVRHRPPPPTVPVWLTEDVVKEAATWAKKTKSKGIIWYNDNAVGERLKLQGIPTFGAGQFPVLNGDVIACSIRAHGTGKNLQAYHKNLILSFPGNGGRIEQLIGRTHRPGQDADEVVVDFLGHTSAFRDAVRGAVKDATYLEGVTTNAQKLTLGTWDVTFDRFSEFEKGAMFDGSGEPEENDEDFGEGS